MINWRIPEFCRDYTHVTGEQLLEIFKADKPARAQVDTETWYNPLNTKAVIRFIQGSKNNEPFGFSFRWLGKCYWVTKGFEYLTAILSSDTVWENQNMKYDFHMMANIDLPIPKYWEDTSILIQVLSPSQKCIRPDGSLKETKALKNMAYHFLERGGKLRGRVDLKLPQLTDTQILEEYVDEARSEIAKERGCKKEEVSYKDVNDKYPELMMYYACVDVHLVDMLCPAFMHELVTDGQEPAYLQDKEATLWLLDMERSGIRMDVEQMQADELKLNEYINYLTPLIVAEAGRSFNINASRDLVEVFEKQFGVKWIWETDKGEVSTTKETLLFVAESHPETKAFVELVLEYRHAVHIRDTYIVGLYAFIQNGRIHADLWLSSNDKSEGATVTGRLSSANPNMQNNPKKPVKLSHGDYSVEMKTRSYFIPDDGCVFVRFDGDQQEYRALGHYSNDPDFMKIIEAGQDIHKGTAAMIFKILYEEVTDELRDIGKKTNFSLVYQLGNAQFAYNMGKKINLKLHKLAGRLLYPILPAFNLPPYKFTMTAQVATEVVLKSYTHEILEQKFPKNPPSEETIKEAIEYFFSEEAVEAIQYAIDTKKKYFAQFPQMKAFLDQAKSVAKSRGWVKNFYGRKYYLENPSEEAYKAPNYIIQGSCSGICKDRGVATNNFLKERRRSPLTRPFVPIHDEIGFQFAFEDLHLAPACQTMLGDIPFRVPMTWGADWGTDFAERIDLNTEADWLELFNKFKVA